MSIVSACGDVRRGAMWCGVVLCCGAARREASRRVCCVVMRDALRRCCGMPIVWCDTLCCGVVCMGDGAWVNARCACKIAYGWCDMVCCDVVTLCDSVLYNVSVGLVLIRGVMSRVDMRHIVQRCAVVGVVLCYVVMCRDML